MDIEVIKNEKNLIEFKLKGERHTIPNLLRQKLLESKEVEFVAYKLEHPTAEDSMFVLRTKKEKPIKVLKNACTELINDLNEFSNEIKKLK